MNNVLDWYYENKSFISKIIEVVIIVLIIVLIIAILSYVIQHTKIADVTGPASNFHHTEGYYTTQMVETCTTSNKVVTCRSYPVTTYHPPTWSFHIMAEDQDWICSVDEYTYAQAVQTKQATASCWTWIK